MRNEFFTVRAVSIVNVHIVNYSFYDSNNYLHEHAQYINFVCQLIPDGIHIGHAVVKIFLECITQL